MLDTTFAARWRLMKENQQSVLVFVQPDDRLADSLARKESASA
jgi:hypothetical protein